MCIDDISPRYQGFNDSTSREVARHSLCQQDDAVRGFPSKRVRRGLIVSSRLAKYQVRAIYCDLELNPPRCVYFNLYTGLLLCGMKMHEHIRTSGIVVPKSTKLILGTSVWWLLVDFLRSIG